MENNNLLAENNFQYEEQNPHYKGRTINPMCAHGPVSDRRCQDIFWIILYGLALAILILIFGIAYQSGDPSRLASPFDTGSNQCGYGHTASYPYIYVISPESYYCVETCPKQIGEKLQCYDYILSSNVCNQVSLYSSQSMLKICYPNDTGFQSLVDSLINISGLDKGFSDIRKTYIVSIIIFFVSLISTFIFLLLVRTCAKFLVWFGIFLIIIFIFTAATLCYIRAENDQAVSIFKTKESLYVIAIVLWVFGAFTLIAIICLFRKIKLAIAVLKAASDFSREVCSAFIVPVFLVILFFSFTVFWIISSLYFASSGEIVKSKGPFAAINWNEGVKRCLVYNLIMYIWNCEISVGFCQFIIASSCSMWYFSQSNRDLSLPVLKSICRACTYQLGSILFGSLILTIVWIFKYLMDQIHKAFKEKLLQHVPQPGEQCIDYCCKCCNCIIKCFEQFIRFISKNAYIMMALSGESFCHSAHDAFYLISRNLMRVSITHGLGSIVVFIAQLLITSICGLIGYLIITQTSTYSEVIYSPLYPTIVFCVIGYIIGTIFVTVFSTAIDTILLCYIVDVELSNGSARSVPPSLKEFLHEYE